MKRLLTYLKLGPANIVRVVVYRLLIKLSIYKYLQPIGSAYSGPFWEWGSFPKPTGPGEHGDHWEKLANRILAGEQLYFSSVWKKTGFPPHTCQKHLVHWSKINEFGLPEGDIKLLWEPSRFDALLTLGLAYLNAPTSALSSAMEDWMDSWVKANPANTGVQWKCGQECALRLMNVLLVSQLLESSKAANPTKGLKRFVIEHCKRISPTMIYAIAQDNNHGTSEAAALYIAGTWLLKQDSDHKEAIHWQRKGRYWLENRVDRLVMKDGSFSQYSANYHRLMLDVVTMAEFWRQVHGDIEFSRTFCERMKSAIAWLSSMTDRKTGNAPNFGANDGARVFALHSLPYRDFRPSLQLASIVFQKQRLLEEGPWDEPTQWLYGKTSFSSNLNQNQSKEIFPDGGLVVLKHGKARGYLRLPNFKFRPGHSDVLHFDLWNDGVNWFRDGGTYSYNTEPKWLDYFPGTESHSTIQFDGRNQMPRFGRFLWGDWPKCEEFSSTGPQTVTAAYTDFRGAYHSRTVSLDSEGNWHIEDHVKGFKEKAVLRWRLLPTAWKRNSTNVSCEDCEFEVISSSPIVRAELMEGHESLHYGELTSLPVFEIEVHGPATFKTIVKFKDI